MGISEMRLRQLGCYLEIEITYLVSKSQFIIQIHYMQYR